MSLKDKEKLMDRNHIPRRLKSANHKTNEAERTKNQLRKDATFYVFPKKCDISEGVAALQVQ